MKQTIKTIKMITIGLLTFCTMAFTNSAFAGTKNDTPVELKLVGQIKNQLAIQLNLNNREQGAYFINIKSMNYHSLYSEIMEGVNISKIFKFNFDADSIDAPGFLVRVEVTSGKTHKTQIYEISCDSSVTKNFVVAKL